jgi:hypothetical protein
MAAELLIDSIWKSEDGCQSTYLARVYRAGEWEVIELPTDVAEKVIADLKEALGNLRNTMGR